MASLKQLQHDLAWADTTASVLVTARDAFAYTLDLTDLFGRDCVTFWAAPVMAGAVAADGRDAIAFASSLPPEPWGSATPGADAGQGRGLPRDQSLGGDPLEHGAAAQDADAPDDALGVSRHAGPQPTLTDAPGPEESPTALTGQPRPRRSDALAADGTRFLHDAARPVLAPARSASDVADEIASGDLARLYQVLAARLNGEATRVADAADRAACQRAAVYAAEIGALLPGSGP